MVPIPHLATVLVLAVALVAIHQWVLDSPLFELGEVSWFPTGGDVPAGTALARGAAAALVPLVATGAAAVLVATAPFGVWVWGIVVLLAATVSLSPLLAVYRYDVRRPTPDEAATIEALPDLECEVVVVLEGGAGPVNGYAIGGPFRDVIGVGEFALARLPSGQVAALLAHEACHHRERHVLVRGAASVAVVATGAAVVTTLFEALVPAATLCLVATVLVERVVAHWVMRRLEYRADAVAAERTSREAVVGLLETLSAATAVDQDRVPRFERLLSTHPAYADRIARLGGEQAGGTDRGDAATVADSR